MLLRRILTATPTRRHLWEAFRDRRNNPLAHQTRRKQGRYLLLSFIWPLAFGGLLMGLGLWLAALALYGLGEFLDDYSSAFLVFLLLGFYGTALLVFCPLMVHIYSVRPKSKEALEELLLTGLAPREIVFGTLWRGTERYLSVAALPILGACALAAAMAWNMAIQGGGGRYYREFALDSGTLLLLLSPAFMACWALVVLALAIRNWIEHPNNLLAVAFWTIIEAPLWALLGGAWYSAVCDLTEAASLLCGLILTGDGTEIDYWSYMTRGPGWTIATGSLIAFTSILGWAFWTRGAWRETLRGVSERYFREAGEHSSAALWWLGAERAAAKERTGQDIHRQTLAARPGLFGRTVVCGLLAVLCLALWNVLVVLATPRDTIWSGLRGVYAAHPTSLWWVLTPKGNMNYGALAPPLLLGPPLSAALAGLFRMRRILVAGALRPSLLWPAFRSWWPFALVGWSIILLASIADLPTNNYPLLWTGLAPVLSYALTALVLCIQMETPSHRGMVRWSFLLAMGVLGLFTLFLLPYSTYSDTVLFQLFSSTYAAAAAGLIIVLAHRTTFGGFQATAQRLHERHLRGLPFFTVVDLDVPRPTEEP